MIKKLMLVVVGIWFVGAVGMKEDKKFEFPKKFGYFSSKLKPPVSEEQHLSIKEASDKIGYYPQINLERTKFKVEVKTFNNERIEINGYCRDRLKKIKDAIKDGTLDDLFKNMRFATEKNCALIFNLLSSSELPDGLFLGNKKQYPNSQQREFIRGAVKNIDAQQLIECIFLAYFLDIPVFVNQWTPLLFGKKISDELINNCETIFQGYEKTVLFAMSKLVTPNYYNFEGSFGTQLIGKVETLQELLFIIAFRQSWFSENLLTGAIYENLSKELKEYLQWQKNQKTVILTFKDYQITEVPKKYYEKSKTIMDSIDERGIGELINIPDQYSQKGFDALLLDDRLFGKLAEGEIDQCVDCYRYLSFPIDDEDLKKKVLELLLNHPGHKIVLKGKFFLPLVIKKYETFKKPTLDANYIFYDTSAQAFFHSVCRTKYVKLTMGKLDGISDEIYSEIYIDSFYQNYKKRNQRIARNIISCSSINDFYSSHNYYFCNWVNDSLYNYDLDIQCSLEGALKGNNIDLCLKSSSGFRPTRFLLKKSFIALSGSKFNEYICKDFVTDGINLFILAKHKDKPEQLLIHYIFDFKRLKTMLKTLNNKPSDITDICVLNAVYDEKKIADINTITALVMCPQSRCLIFGFNDGSLKFFNSDTTILYGCDIQVNAPITYLAVDQDEKLLAINTKDDCFFYPLIIISSTSKPLVVKDQEASYKELTTIKNISASISKKEQYSASITFVESLKTNYDPVKRYTYGLSKNDQGEDQYDIYECVGRDYKKLLVLEKNNDTWRQLKNISEKSGRISYIPFCKRELFDFYKEFKEINNNKYKDIICKISGKDFFVIRCINDQSDPSDHGNPEVFFGYEEHSSYGKCISLRAQDIIKQSKAIGTAIFDCCTNGKQIFMLTNDNEILYCTIEQIRTENNPTLKCVFKKKYDTFVKKKTITAIAYSQKYHAIIVGFEDGTLEGLVIENGEVFGVQCPFFNDEIYDIVFNSDETSLLLASKKQYAIYNFDTMSGLSENDFSKMIGLSENEKTSFSFSEVLTSGVILTGLYALYKYLAAPKKAPENVGKIIKKKTN